MSPTRKLFANAAIAVGSSAALLLGMTGTANADPAAPLPIDAMQAPGYAGNGGPQPGDSEGGLRSVQRGLDAHGGRGSVHRELGGTRGLEECGVGGQQFRRATGRGARARTGCGAGRRGSPACGRRPGQCRRTGAGGLAGACSRGCDRHRRPVPATRRLRPTAHRPLPRPPRIRSSVPTRRRRRTSCTRRSATGA